MSSIKSRRQLLAAFVATRRVRRARLGRLDASRCRNRLRLEDQRSVRKRSANNRRLDHVAIFRVLSFLQRLFTSFTKNQLLGESSIRKSSICVSALRRLTISKVNIAARPLAHLITD